MGNIRKVIVITFSLLLVINTCFANPTISAKFEETPLSNALYSLAAASKTQIIINGDVKGNVTMTFEDQDFNKILDLLSGAFEFKWVDRDGTIVITPGKTTVTKTFRIKNVDLLESLKKQLGLFIEKLVVDEEASTITVDASPILVEKATQLIAQNDVMTKQVIIQAKMVELSHEDTLNLGLDYTWNSFDSTKTPWKFTYTGSLQAQQILSIGNVIARPMITTFNGHKAKILLGDNVPIFSKNTDNGSTTESVEYKDVGVELEVTPQINDGEEGYVTMKVKPKVSVITKEVKTDTLTAPQTSTREAETMVRVKSGETLVIGGLLKEDDIETLTKIPYLGDLPVLGKLFSHTDRTKKKSEIFIFISPQIEGFTAQPTVGTEFPDMKPMKTDIIPEPAKPDIPVSLPISNQSVQPVQAPAAPISIDSNELTKLTKKVLSSYDQNTLAEALKAVPDEKKADFTLCAVASAMATGNMVLPELENVQQDAAYYLSLSLQNKMFQFGRPYTLKNIFKNGNYLETYSVVENLIWRQLDSDQIEKILTAIETKKISMPNALTIIQKAEQTLSAEKNYQIVMALI